MKSAKNIFCIEKKGSRKYFLNLYHMELIKMIPVNKIFFDTDR